MPNSTASGERLRELRNGNGLTQEALAERAGLSPGVIKKIERGGSTRIETYHALARALDVRTSALFEPSGHQRNEHADDHAIDLMALRQAISPPVILPGRLQLDASNEEPDVARLRQTTRALDRSYGQDDYARVGEVLPALVRSAHFAVEHFDHGSGRTEALRVRAHALKLAGRYLTQVRAYDLAHLALRDAFRDAAAADDRLTAASAVAVQGWTLVRQGRFDEAEQLTAATADEVEPRISRASRHELGAWGRLLRRSSSAAARNNRPAEAREMLRLARTAAAALGGATDAQLPRGGFGQVSVALQAIENHMVARHPHRVLGLASRIPATVVSDSDGWRRHLLTVAQAHVVLRHDGDPLEILDGLHARRPEWLRHQRAAADVFRDARALRKRPLTGQQRALGQFLGVG